MNMRHGWLLVVLGVTAMVALQPEPSAAQDAPRRTGPQAAEPNNRKLGGHMFIPSTRLLDPFINTWIRQTTGVGVAYDVATVVPDLEGNPRVFVGDMTFLGLGFGYQQAFNNWLAGYITVGGGARVGTDAESILSTGLNAFMDVTLGGKARLWSNPKFLLTGSLDYASTGVNGVSVLNWAREVIDSGTLSDSLLVTETSTGSFRGGFTLSFAAAKWIGFTGAGVAGIGNATGDLESEFAYVAQIAASIDLNPVSPIPLGVILGYDYNSFAMEGGEITDSIHALLFGLFYTGRDDFSIGLELQNADIPMSTVATTVNTNEATVNIRYYF